VGGTVAVANIKLSDLFLKQETCSESWRSCSLSWNVTSSRLKEVTLKLKVLLKYQFLNRKE
jgi:hypothetical protein